MRTIQRVRGVKSTGENEGDLSVPARPINALFTAALTLEAKLVAAGFDMPVGSSVLCLATKP